MTKLKINRGAYARTDEIAKQLIARSLSPSHLQTRVRAVGRDLSDNIDLGDLASTPIIVLEAEPFSRTAETPGQEKKKMDSSPAAATDKDQAPEDVVEDPGEGDKEDWEEEDSFCL
ncbi:hypothetical protein R1sor_008060 [Riccia sorocarpa]|uniref:Uncharacterized protein n=1 Tax=Riccia sorocarpa TaxID=122646 RepID=A0ABD3HVR2_9MARC